MLKVSRFVEIYAVPKFSTQRNFLGLASKVDVDRWTLKVHTTQSPNGEYRLFARTQNQYGAFDSDFVPFMIFNEVVSAYTIEQQESVAILEEVYERTERISNPNCADYH